MRRWPPSTLPKEMSESGRRARAYERGLLDLVEALVLAEHVGREFTGTVVELDRPSGGMERGTMQILDPAVEAPVSGSDLDLGAEIAARLVTADLVSGAVEFRVA